MTVTTTEPVVQEVDLRTVLTTRARPARPSGAAASLSFAWRAVLKMKHVPMQLFDVTAFPVMSTVLFTYLFGGALAGSTSAYLQDLLPGVTVMSVAMITPYLGMGLNTDITKGVFDRFRSMPIWGPAPLVGAMLGDTVRYALAATLTVVVGVVLGFRPDAGVVGVVLAIALLLVFSFSLSWVWALVGLRVSSPESVMGVAMMVLFPLTFASNVFVDPATMPGWVQGFVQVNPVTHLATASRGLMHGGAELGDIAWVLGSCLVLVAVFAPLTVRQYRAER